MEIEDTKWAAAYILNDSGLTDFYNLIIEKGNLLKFDDSQLIEHREPYDIKVFFRTPEEIKRYPDAREGQNICARLIRKTKEGNICVDPVIASYGQIMDTSDCLLHEAYCFAGIAFDPRKRKLSMTSKNVLQQMPWRYKLHKKEGGPKNVITKPSHRAAGLGVACLTAYRDEKGLWRRILIRRGSEVGTYPNEKHVVPAGMANYRGSYEPGDLLKIVESEFLEELFNQKQLERKEKIMRWKEEVEHLSRKLIYGQEGKNQVKVIISGIALDLCNLRPEVCVLMAINSPEWNKQHVLDNWEDKKISTGKVEEMWRIQPNYEIAEFVDNDKTILLLDEILQRDAYLVLPTEVVQSGAVAFILGSAFLREISDSS